MERLRKKPRGEKVYTGSYVYSRNRNEYSEEDFQVWLNPDNYALTFYADVFGRVITGELLKIHVDYRVSKDFIPQWVAVRRSLGNRSITEAFRYKRDEGVLTYTFASGSDVHEEDVPTHSVFSIAAPACCTSFLFLGTKKEDVNNSNTYYVFRSFNKWRFSEAPSSMPITVRRESTSHQQVALGGKSKAKTLAIPYRVFEKETDAASEPSFLTFVSKYICIPCLVRSPEGTLIQMSKFHNFDKDAV